MLAGISDNANASATSRLRVVIEQVRAALENRTESGEEALEDALQLARDEATRLDAVGKEAERLGMPATPDEALKLIAVPEAIQVVAAGQRKAWDYILEAATSGDATWCDDALELVGACDEALSEIEDVVNDITALFEDGEDYLDDPCGDEGF